MKYVINSHNTTSIGTYTLTEQFIRYLSEMKQASGEDKYYVVLPNAKMLHLYSSNNTQFICFYNFRNCFRIVLRCIYDFLIFPLYTFLIKPKSVLIMANYCPMKVCGKKVVFMRHSYLADDNIYRKVTLRTKVIEKLRRWYFILTIKSIDVLIVQTHYMKKLISDKYPLTNTDIQVLPNPITSTFRCRERSRKRPVLSQDVLFYPSRYYPHKNHSFIAEIARKYSSELRRKNMKFHVTLNSNSNRGVVRLMNLIREEGLNDIIINIGEVPQEEIVQYYLQASLLFFPSQSESFGNPIVEAMALGLPIIVPNLPYSKTLCEECAVYYEDDNIDDAYKKLTLICENKVLWEQFSQKSFEQSKYFPTVSEWAHTLLSIMKS